MSNRRRQQAPGGARRRALTAPVTIIGAGGLVVWGIGAADAATGGSFVLGKANSETSTAVLTNSKGIPLSLKAKSGSPPLTVNSSKLVARLNAAEVGGLSASKLQRRLGSTTCATGIGHVSATGGVTCAHNQLVFTSNGSFTVPAGVTHVTGELWGGGGGGAGYDYPNQPTGGGQGGYAKILLTVTAGQTYDLTIGTAGAGAGGPGDGTAGGTTVLSRNSAELAAATGGASGHAGCGNHGVGGIGQLFTTANIDGLSEVTGADGTCPHGGGAVSFHGSGGDGGYFGGYNGQPGLVLISFSA